ncbi:hypothetical protein [Xanthobacter versatilis]|uniref:hypothetical protein n=1 Tax=Xanthobacter autotrophicus (strain ATCC BAA-1158 / Py2) TaxID=78245 RepID=UPI00372B07CF
MRKPPRYLLGPKTLIVERKQAKLLKTWGVEGFETSDDAHGRHLAMLRRFTRRGIKFKRRKAFAECYPNGNCKDVSRCPAACHHASRRERARLIVRLNQRLRDVGDPAWLITVVRDRWRQAPGDLHHCDPASLLKWFCRRLERLPNPGLAKGIVGVDVSLNEDGDERWWQPHLHAVVAGVDKAALRKALKLKSTKSTVRPLVIIEIKRTDIGTTIGYALKRSVEKRVGYLDEEGERDQRTVRVPARFLVEHDRWLLGQKVTKRFRVIRMRLSRAPLVDETSIRPLRKRPLRRIRRRS